jgi:predicted NAD-dependent protein-ADP-ribosyltransferase YbiA (DUF1768 family)
MSTLRFFRDNAEHGFLSTFYTLATPLRTPRFLCYAPTAEHYFHALLFDYEDAPDENKQMVELICQQPTPYKARLVGSAAHRTIKVEEWKQDLIDKARSIGGTLGDDDDSAARLVRMRKALERKFTDDQDCRQMLASTRPHRLEMESEHDKFWGRRGSNWMGLLLEEVRATIHEDYSHLSNMYESPSALDQDAHTVRRRVASLGARPEMAARLGTHLYPRSFSYSVDSRGYGTLVHMYGVNALGETVAIDVSGYSPYMFVRAYDATDEQIHEFVEQLRLAMRVVLLAQHRWQRDVREAVTQRGAALLVRYAVVEGVSMKACGEDRGFNASRSERFIQLWWYAPVCVKAVRDLLEWAYEQRERQFATRDELVASMVEGVIKARERAEAAMPQTDVKGHVKSTTNKRSQNEQRLINEASKSRRTLDQLIASERNAAAAARRSDVGEEVRNCFGNFIFRNFKMYFQNYILKFLNINSSNPNHQAPRTHECRRR